MSYGLYAASTPILPVARNAGELVIEIDAKNPFPPPPYELLGSISDNTYQARMRTLTAHLKRYNWSLFERIYLTIAIVLTVVVPWPLIFFVQKAMTKSIDTSLNDTTPGGRIIFTQDQLDTFYRARLASFGILVGIAVLTWVPYLVLKFVGTRKLNGILHEFNTNEGKEIPAGGMPRWSVRSISVFRQRAQVIVSLPITLRGVSSFHPNAYLPAYVAQPGVWQTQGTWQGQGQWQGVPLDEKRG